MILEVALLADTTGTAILVIVVAVIAAVSAAVLVKLLDRLRKKDAETFHAKTSVEVVKRTHVAEGATVSVKEAGQLWLQSCEADGLERGTLLQYRQHLELHINPFIGSVLLSKVSVPLVRGFQDRLREDGRSPAMIDKVTRSLGSLLVGAQERGLAKLHCFFDTSLCEPT